MHPQASSPVIDMSALFAVETILLPVIFYGFSTLHATGFSNFVNGIFTELTNSSQRNLTTEWTFGRINSLQYAFFQDTKVFFVHTHFSESDFLTPDMETSF